MSNIVKCPRFSFIKSSPSSLTIITTKQIVQNYGFAIRGKSGVGRDTTLTSKPQLYHGLNFISYLRKFALNYDGVEQSYKSRKGASQKTVPTC